MPPLHPAIVLQLSYHCPLHFWIDKFLLTRTSLMMDSIIDTIHLMETNKIFMLIQVIVNKQQTDDNLLSVRYVSHFVCHYCIKGRPVDDLCYIPKNLQGHDFDHRILNFISLIIALKPFLNIQVIFQLQSQKLIKVCLCHHHYLGKEDLVL